MLLSTIAFDNFVKFHIRSDGDCKKIRRIETAIRGEELYRTFSGAHPGLRKILFRVFDFIAWTFLAARDNQEIPSDIRTNYDEAVASLRAWNMDVVTNGLAAFTDFVKKYVFSIAIQNTDYFKKLPEDSPHENARVVCETFRAYEHDVFPTYVQNPTCPIETSSVRLPANLPSFLMPPHDPLLVLCDAASVFLGV
jgi:hypothetical protein